MKHDDADKVRFVTIPSDNFVTNSAVVLAEVFRSPNIGTVVSTGAALPSDSSLSANALVVKAQPPAAQPPLE